MIPMLETIEAAPRVIRIMPNEMSAARLESLRDGVIDFCKRSKSPGDAMNTWAYITRIMRGQDIADLWWSFQGDTVMMFAVIKVYQDFDGKWTAYVLDGWNRSPDIKDHVKTIVDDYVKKGVARIQFVTRRSPRAFKRWLGLGWRSAGILFERRS
jgi:hypothetical protein